MENPFTLSFGTEPPEHIERLLQKDEIIKAFSADLPPTYVYMISGIRGAGKTVLLSNISDYFSAQKNWLVVHISPETDILQKIAAKLYSINSLKKLFINAKLDFSAFGLGISIENGNQIFDMETALERMLTEIAKQKKKLLIAIDEIVSNEHVRIFSSIFQLLIRQKLPIYLLMTGLYENINNLQNEKSLTFLYRAPKITLDPLSINSVSRCYKRVFEIDEETAAHMAKLTKGYPFAFQVLGYLYWKRREDGSAKCADDIIPEYDDYLESYVYEKVWHELAPKEKDIAGVISRHEGIKIADIREKLSLSSSEMSVYRDKLKKKGIIDTSRYGHISFKLPRFGEIIRLWAEE